MEEYEFDSAEEFLNFLRPSSSRWWDGVANKRNHVFRGHARANWKLLPHGWRPLGPANKLTPLVQAFEVFFGPGIRDDSGGYREGAQLSLWRLALAEAAFHFSSIGRQTGLPTHWHTQGSMFEHHFLSEFSVPTVPMELLSLAQHHGIPTQLLDWSEDPLTAAYFALGEPSDEDLCVWALRNHRTVYSGEPRLTLSSVSTLGNENIRAQSGMFLSYEQGPYLDLIFKGGWPPFEEHDELPENLVKIVLEGSERELLRDLLLREGRSAAHLMPSWEASARTAMQSWPRLAGDD